MGTKAALRFKRIEACSGVGTDFLRGKGMLGFEIKLRSDIADGQSGCARRELLCHPRKFICCIEIAERNNGKTSGPLAKLSCRK